MTLPRSAIDSMAWIRANLARDGGICVSSNQRLAYPEVTGYLIPTLLRRGERELAERFGRWLVSVQRPDGSFLDPEGRASFAFDTGQVIRGLVALLDVMPEVEQPLRRACDWMIAASGADARLPIDARLDAWDMGDRGRICEGVHLYALPGLVAAGEKLGETGLIDFARRSRNGYVDRLDLVAFRRRNQLTHLFCYVQEALFDLGLEDMAAAGMRELAQFQKGDGSVPAFSDVSWVCTPGQLQAAIVWQKLGEHERAERALAFAESLVCSSQGFLGSYGDGAAYFADDEPSWAVKFHMDAVDQVRGAAVAPRVADPVAAAPARAGKTLDANLAPDDWHDSIVGDLSPADVAARVRTGGVPPWVRPVLDVTRAGDRVLELGSGTGELSAALAREGRRVTLLDFSEKSLALSRGVLRTLGLEGEHVRGDVLGRLPFSDGAFDCVWSSGLLEHFDDHLIRHIVHESARVSRGCVLSLVPNARSLPYRLGKWDQERAGTWIWGREDPKASLKEAFEAAGLEQVREWSIAPEHAVRFLDDAGRGDLARAVTAFYAALPPAALAELDQGYLLVTTGVKKARRREREEEPAAKTPARARQGDVRRLAVVPSDPVQAYVDAGYPDLTRYFNPTGVFDEVYCLAEHEPRERELYGMKVIPTKRAQLGERMRELRIDALRAYDLPAGRWADAARDRSVPFVVSVHDVEPSRFSPGLPAADLFLAMSGAVESRLIEHGARRERVRRLPNRVDLGVFRRKDDAAARARFDAAFPGKHRVLHVGRRCPQKNIETVLESLALLGDDWVGIFVGRGDAAPYRARAEGLGIASRCHFVDAVPNEELAHWYSYASCLCVPSLWEGFGVVFIEALACSAPVVTTDLAPMNELISDGKNGLLLREPQDAEGLADLLRLACENPDVRARLTKNARRAARPFSRRAIDARERDVYRSLLRAEAAPMPRVETVVGAPEAHVPLRRDGVKAVPLRRPLAPAWDAIVASSPDAWFFHRFAEQVLLEEAWPSESASFLLEIGGRHVAACPLQRWRHDRDVLHSTLMGTGGPAIAGDLSADDRLFVEETLHGILHELMRQPGVRALHVALPPLSRTSREAGSTNPLLRHGWSDESTLTSVVDLDRPVEAIWNGMHASYRADVERARGHGLSIDPATACTHDLDEYYRLHVETYTRTGVEPHPRAYFEAIFRHFVADGSATILFARRDGRAIGAANVATFGDASLYWTGAYGADALATGAGKLLQWEAMLRMRERGVTRHETGEVFPAARAGSKEAGLTLFKRRFGGTIVPFFKGSLTNPDLRGRRR